MKLAMTLEQARKKKLCLAIELTCKMIEAYQAAGRLSQGGTMRSDAWTAAQPTKHVEQCARVTDDAVE